MDRGIPAEPDPRHDLGHPRQGRRHRDPAARMPSLVADQAEGRQLHLRRADGLHRLCRRQSALLPLRRHRDLLRPQAAGRALQAECRLHRHRQPAGDPAPQPDAGRDADRRDEPLRGRARNAMARPRDGAALPLHHARRRQGRRRIHEAPPRGESARREDRRPLSAAAPATGSSSTRPARSCGRPRQPEPMRAAIFDAPFAIRMAEAPKPAPQAGRGAGAR